MGPEYPLLVRHCALAIYKSKYCTGTKVEQIQGSLEIAIRQLHRSKHLRVRPNVKKVAPEDVALTAKGRVAESIHRNEVDSRSKTKEWANLYELIQEEIAEKPDEGTREVASETLPIPDQTKAPQKRQRLATAMRSAAKRSPRRRPRRPRRAKRR